MPKMPRRSRNKAQKITAGLCLGLVAASSGWSFTALNINGGHTINSEANHTNQNNTVSGGLVVEGGAYAKLYGVPTSGHSFTNTIVGGLTVKGNNTYAALGNGVSGNGSDVNGGSGDMYNNIDTITVGEVGIGNTKFPVANLSNKGVGSVTNTDDQARVTGAAGTGLNLVVQGDGGVSMDNQTTGSMHNYMNQIQLNVEPGDSILGGIISLSCDGGSMLNTVSDSVTVSGKGKLYFDNAGILVNCIKNGINVSENGTVYLENYDTGTLENNISGGIKLDDSGAIYLSCNDSGSSTNNVSGGIEINGGSASFAGATSGSIVNNISGGITMKGKSLNFSSEKTGSVTNNITGGITINGSKVDTVNFANYSSGTNSSTIDTIHLQETGTGFLGLVFGGNGSTTQINHMNWTGGRMTFMFANGSWGNTHFTNLDIAGSVKIKLINSTASSYNTTDRLLPSGSHTLFTVGTFTGDANNIMVENLMPLTEVTQVIGGYGASINDQRHVVINLIPVATAPDTVASAQMSVDTAAAAGAAAGAGATTQSALDSMPGGEFTFSPLSPYMQARKRLKLREAMRTNPHTPLENLAVAMAEDQNEGPYIIKTKGDYRLWTSPYAVDIHNAGSAGVGTGFSEKDYGMLLGVSTFMKSIQMGLSGVVGVGLIDQQMEAKKNSKTKGKQFLAGLTAASKIFTDYEWVSSLYGVLVWRNQYRQGDPSIIQSYIAQSRYKTYMLSLQNELGRVFKLANHYSVRPSVGVQMGASRREAFVEKLTSKWGSVDDATFAQRYKTKNSFSGEVYTGAGLRKKWDGERFEGKITVTYQVGQKSGNGKARTDVAAGNQSLSVSSATPGRFTQYINVYGSLLDKQSNWKLIPSATVTLQRGQRSITTSVKAEYRF